MVAVALVNLRRLASGLGAADRPAHEVVPGRGVEVLCTWRDKTPRALSAGAFVQALARLGGWIPRKQPPGWVVLWRGWNYTTARTKRPWREAVVAFCRGQVDTGRYGLLCPLV